MMRKRFTPLTAVSVSAMLLAAALTACSPPGDDDGGGGDSSGPIVIGASVPLSGPLAGFGSFVQWGYQHAVDEVNAAGGIEVDGEKRKVELKIVDDKTDPNQVTTNIKTLISSDDSVALLGSCTPDLVNPGALVADSQKIPFVTGCNPLEVFTSVKDWTYAWDIFFSVPELAALSFQTMGELGLETNKKVAILHDNGPDGKAVGNEIWPAIAEQSGFEVVANVEFPSDNTDFSAAVQEAKNSGAEILLVDAITPQSISLRKQMAAVGWTPKIMVSEKGAEPVQYAEALGDLADGVMVGAYWDPSFDYAGSAELQAAWESDNPDQSSSQHIADSYTAAMVLMDAIAAAGSTDAEEINTAIGETNKEYPVGPVQFAEDNTAKIAVANSQWQDGKPVIVFPADRATGEVLFPLPGS